ncbi:hypothetical protein [Roseobacter sinensis]|uniref:Sulfotransferase family protein n=1 Tax=Roseobacter sinensis TaxID=2931391 RepID=A0ABT3BH86_9RHOB|nr:hypothetical protein [Roseobacter sp. WL0113]MCV3272952.1 hypothetical protein [Roseobacter sp. WL0113]
MDVILHLGAHRTGTKTFQDYLRRQAETLNTAQTGYWGPGRTRRGLFSGLVSKTRTAKARDLSRRAEARIQLQLSAAQARGLRMLLISDENMIGSLKDNIRTGSLYPDIGARMACFARALDGQLSTVILSPRSLEYYWSSAIAYGAAHGHPIPDPDGLRKIAQATRSWRDVVTDLAAAMPGTEIRVMPFEAFAGRPNALLEHGVGVAAPRDADRVWLNQAPSLPELRRVLADCGADGSALPFGMGRWNPFTPEETAALREAYADDMMWLVAGADGLATLTEDRARTRAASSLPAGAPTEGHGNEHKERQMARPG